MEQTLKALGKRIAYLRNKKGLTQEQLAELVHYSTNHISKLELARTKPSFELLFEISKALDIELREIFNFEEFKDIKYIKSVLKKVINSSDSKKVKLVYNLFRAIEF
ncbi:helix-turn-helix transcriptional regulator [bacterium]|nr:helix-turn-helix transcriptional regulator [bacterium]